MQASNAKQRNKLHEESLALVEDNKDKLTSFGITTSPQTGYSKIHNQLIQRQRIRRSSR